MHWVTIIFRNHVPQSYADLQHRNFQINYSDIYTAGDTNSASYTSLIVPYYYHCFSSKNVYYM